jgi:hypothetical protein
MAFIKESSARSACVSLMKPNEVGFCSISKDATPCITFYVDPAHVEYSTSLIASTCALLMPYFNKSQRIYVDADTSDGLYDKLGFQPCPLYEFTEDQRHLEGAGYEKYILFSTLCSEVLI